MMAKSTTPSLIDVVIPTISKDYALLETVTASLEAIADQINAIYIVSSSNAELEKFCALHGYRFIDERQVLGYGREKISYRVDGIDRSGWLLQQLLKLAGDTFVEQDNYFVIDSDTVLLNPHQLIDGNNFTFFQSEEWHEPYFRTFKKMFGYPTRNTLSFTSHMMIFDRQFLKEMKEELEQKHGHSWDSVYRSMIDQTEASCISDYDTYANWVLIHYPERVHQIPFYNQALSRTALQPLDELKQKYGKQYNSLSFHSYLADQ